MLRRDRVTPAAYTEKRYTVKLTAEVMIRIVDPVTRKALDEATVSPRPPPSSAAPLTTGTT